MNRTENEFTLSPVASRNSGLLVLCFAVNCLLSFSFQAAGGVGVKGASQWSAGPPLFLRGEAGSFDDGGVKDPSIVYCNARWHMFYTAVGQNKCVVGYAQAEALTQFRTARHFQLFQAHGRTQAGHRYVCAPQVFFFQPKKTWFLIYQTRDSNYQPVYSTTKTVDVPSSWSEPIDLVEKTDLAKWIDFWVICDEEKAYFFYTRNHADVYVMTTRLSDFPSGFANPRKMFSGVLEAVHIYHVTGRGQYHMFYEISKNRRRQYGLAEADHLLGPWRKVNDGLAVGGHLIFDRGVVPWTDQVSHGEMIRVGFDQKLEYDSETPRFLIQGRFSYQGVFQLGIIAPRN